MCVSKCVGGMRFRDLELFNKAMLAKVSWRIIRKPDNLMARTLKGKYFQDGNFLKAKTNNNAFLTWRKV